MRIHFRYLAYLLLALGFSLAHAGSYEDYFEGIEQDNPRIVRGLLQRGFDPDTLNPERLHGLWLALKDNRLKVAEVLIDWPKTNVEWRTPRDESPLMMASLRGQLELVRKLIARDAHVNKPGWAPLHYAATGGHVQVIELLLEEHAFIDAESPNKTTPLMMAAQYGTPEAVKALLEAGADADMRNDLGLTAVDFALRVKRKPVADMIAAAMRRPQPRGKW